MVEKRTVFEIRSLGVLGAGGLIHVAWVKTRSYKKDNAGLVQTELGTIISLSQAPESYCLDNFLKEFPIH